MKPKVMLVGGIVEVNEMTKMAEGLIETGYLPVIHQFGEDESGKALVKRLLDKISSEKPEIVFTRKNSYPSSGSKEIFEEIGTTYIPEHLLKIGIPVVGSDGETIKLLRRKSACDAKLYDQNAPYANDFILIDPNSPSARPYGIVKLKRGFTTEDLENPFVRHPVLFIKPNSLGRSSGVEDSNVLHNLEELVARAKELGEQFPKIPLIIHPFYPGTEYTVGVIGNEEKIVLPVKVCQQEGYSMHKILRDGVKKGGIPSGRVYIEKISKNDIAKRLAENAGSIYKILRISDYTRMDFRETCQGDLKVIDVNGVPGVKKSESYIAIGAQMAFGGQEGNYSVYGRLVSSLVYAGAKRLGIPIDEHPTLFGLHNKLLG